MASEEGLTRRNFLAGIATMGLGSSIAHLLFG